MVDGALGATEETHRRYQRKLPNPRILNDEVGRPGSDGRNRRSGGSFSDEGVVPTSDGLWEEDLRVGWPSLCTTPVDVIHLSIDHLMGNALFWKTSTGESMHQRIMDVLSARQIRFHSINVLYGISRYEREPATILTLLIIAP